MLELCYNFFQIFCDTGKYEEFAMDTNLLYLAQSDENLGDVTVPQKTRRLECDAFERLHRHFHSQRSREFFSEMCCNTHMKDNKREPGLFRKEFWCSVVLC